jgi:primosomal protein N' (replication factor Y)
LGSPLFKKSSVGGFSRGGYFTERKRIKYYYEVIPKGKEVTLTYFWHERISTFQFVTIPILEQLHDGIIYREVTEKDIDFDISKVLSIQYLQPFHLPTPYFRSVVFMKNYYFNSFSTVLNFFHRHPFQYGKSSIPQFQQVNLSEKQNVVFEEISKHQTSLLFGDTGTGKTRIYKKAISENLQNGNDTLFLVPEINLIPQTLRRLENFFGEIVQSWHSRISSKEKSEILNSIQRGKTKIIVGTLSSLFMPFENLKLIIVDEEHSDSYILDTEIKFSAKEMAIYLGKQLNAKVVLGSATPSIQSFHKFPTIRLKSEHKKKFFFDTSSDEVSQFILQKIHEKLQKNEQVIVFVPIRGNFKSLSCQNCGKKFECPNCSIKLSLYSDDSILKCNKCGFSSKTPEVCDECGSDEITSSRLGTLEIMNRLRAVFPEKSVENFDSDKTKKSGELQKTLEAFREKEIDILVGTQMISKGHDYPNVSLSVILGIDFLINIADYRSFEKTVSLITQIAGRSGRSGNGETIIQTKYEKLYSQFLDNYENFILFELGHRENKYPPFRYIYKIDISHSQKKRGEEILNHLSIYIAIFGKKTELIYSDKAPIEKENKKWQFQILLRSFDVSETNKFLNETLKLIPKSFLKWISLKRN